jgi:hypothetical protein
MRQKENPFQRVIKSDYWYTSWMIQGATENAGFRDYLLERLAYHVEYTFVTENAVEIYNDYYKLIKPEVAKERAKWGKTVEHWEQQTADLLKFYTSADRSKTLIDSIKKTFGLSASKVKYYFG